MSSKSFYLKEPNKSGLCLIMFVYQSKGKKFKLSTKVHTEKSLWTGSLIKGKSLEVMEKNKKLTTFQDTIAEIELEAMRDKRSLTIDVIEQRFRLKIDADPNFSLFFTLYHQFMEDAKFKLAKGTIKCYLWTLNRLQTFSKEKRIEICFENINRGFYDNFVNYLIADLGLLNNSVGKHIKTLKTFLNYVQNHDLIQTRINTHGFKVFKEDIDIVALTEDELFKIYYCKGLSQAEEYVKDYFCLECFTGMRFSDVSRIQHENIKGDFLEFRTQKTKDSLIVPMNVFAKEIFEKYKGRFENSPLPPTLDNASTNYLLKDIGEIAGVKDITIVEKFNGSNRIVLKKPKCDLISTHTGRRTFITLSYEKGMSPEMIMKITGIRSWNTLRKYLKISEKAKLIKMNEYWNKEQMRII